MDVRPRFPKAVMQAPAPPLAFDALEQMKVFIGASSLSQGVKSFCTEKGRFICVLGRQMSWIPDSLKLCSIQPFSISLLWVCHCISYRLLCL